MKKLTFDEYQQRSQRTAVDGKPDAILFSCMGLCGETGEVLENINRYYDNETLEISKPEKIKDELGDVLWYLSDIAFKHNQKLSDIHYPGTYCCIKDAGINLAIASANVADYLKKVYGHNHTINLERLKELLGVVLHYMGVISHHSKFDLTDVMDMNIEKLMKRYPEGFESEKSINRVI